VEITLVDDLPRGATAASTRSGSIPTDSGRSVIVSCGLRLRQNAGSRTWPACARRKRSERTCAKPASI
jgi:hypothetical protein